MAYVNDVIISPKTLKEHMDHFMQVFMRIKEAKLKRKVTKCMFAQSGVKLQSHIVNSGRGEFGGFY